MSHIFDEGIPMAHRGKAWTLLWPDPFYIGPVLFENFKQLQGDVDQCIDQDIPRTFPELNPIFEKVHNLSDSLREILIAFGKMRPDVGYTPGMASPVGMLLLHITAPCDSFKLFHNIVMSETLYNFYTGDLVFIKQYYKVFWRLLKETCLQMWQNLSQESVQGNTFLFTWIITLFCQNLQIREAAFLWD